MHSFDALVTGANGFLGRWLLAELTRRGQNVAALVRTAPHDLLTHVDRLGGNAERVHMLLGDVEQEDLGLGSATRARVVYHLAARFAFGLDAESARKTNVFGSLNVARWASHQPHLQRLVWVGGYRMTIPRAGLPAAPAPWSESSLRRAYRSGGTYEISKHESHCALRDAATQNSIPWTTVHPSVVIGDSRTGETTQYLGLADTIERLWRRRLPALLGNARTWLPMTTVDHVAAVLATVPDNPATVSQELVVLDPATPRLLPLLHDIAAHLRVPLPRARLSAGLVRRLPAILRGGVSTEELEFLAEDEYDTRSADAHLDHAGLRRPPIAASILRWCDALVASDFGRNQP